MAPRLHFFPGNNQNSTKLMPENFKILLNSKRTGLLFDQAVIALTASNAALLIFIILFWTLIKETPLFIGWVLTHLLLTGGRFYLVSKYSTSHVLPEDYKKWLVGFKISTLLAGMLWCAFFILIYDQLDIIDRLIIIIGCAGLIAGSVATYSASFLTFFLFSSPQALGLSLYLLITQADRFSMITSVLLITFFTFMILSSRRLSKSALMALQYQIDNMELMKELEEEKTRILKLNEKLENDLEQRIKIESRLLNEKMKAVSLAEQLKTLSTEDALTGISNRRHFDEVLKNEWKRMARNETTLSLIICDIDYFKKYNDLYGHQMGDDCLCNISAVLEENARRGGDFAARYGGEEFVVILPETTDKAATELAELMRLAIEKLKIPHAASIVKNIVTASFGVTSLIPQKDQSPKVLIKFADRALYKAKAEGRNRTTVLLPDKKIEQ